MQSELRLHRFVLTMLVTWLAAFIAMLLYLDPSFANPRLEAIASLAMVVVVATAFVTIGMTEGIIALQFGLRHMRELAAYLLLGMLSVASGIYLALTNEATLQTICVVVAPHAFLFGIGELRLSQQMPQHPKQKRAFLLCGICELILGIALLQGWKLPNNRAAALLGYVAILSTLQLLPFVIYKRQRLSLQAKKS